MSETKPEKRLVSKGQHVQVMRGVIARYLCGTLLLLAGGMALLFTVCMLFLCVAFFPDQTMTVSGTVSNLCLIALLGGTPTALLLWGGKRTNAHAGRIAASIEPITDQNIHLLPAQETLLRGSDLPPTVQQTELLRATQVGQETPKEELLRATLGEE